MTSLWQVNNRDAHGRARPSREPEAPAITSGSVTPCRGDKDGCVYTIARRSEEDAGSACEPALMDAALLFPPTVLYQGLGGDQWHDRERGSGCLSQAIRRDPSNRRLAGIFDANLKRLNERDDVR